MNEQCVSVGLGCGGDLAANLSSRADFCLDDARLLQNRFKHGGQWPADDVGGAAWWERIDEGYGVSWIRIFSKSGAQGEGRGRRGTPGNKSASVHVNPPWKHLFCRGFYLGLCWAGCYRPARWAIKRQ